MIPPPMKNELNVGGEANATILGLAARICLGHSEPKRGHFGIASHNGIMRKYLKSRLESLRPGLTRLKCQGGGSRTSNVQHPTSNAECGRSAGLNIRCSAFSVGCSMFSELASRVASCGLAALGLFTNTPPLQHSIQCPRVKPWSNHAKNEQPVLHQSITPFLLEIESSLVKPLLCNQINPISTFSPFAGASAWRGWAMICFVHGRTERGSMSRSNVRLTGHAKLIHAHLVLPTLLRLSDPRSGAVRECALSP
jgi:hypothetical protein